MGVFAKLDSFIKLGDIKGEFQATDFTGDLVTGQENPGDSLAYAGSLFGEGVFKQKSIEDKGRVIFGDNHFKTGEGGDSLTGNTTSQPTDDFLKLGDIKGFSADQEPGADFSRACGFETLEAIAGMYSFAESLNSALELGGRRPLDPLNSDPGEGFGLPAENVNL